MRKKIIYIITKSNWGGAQRYVFDLATHLPKEEFEVAVAFGGDGSKDGKKGLLALKLQEAGIRTIFIQSFMRDISLIQELRAFRELRQIFKIEKPDVVHLNSSKAGGIGALAARMAGAKTIIFTAHGWPFLENRNILARGVIYLLSWLTALLATKVIVVSNYDLATTKRMPFVEHKVVRIYNGIDLNFPLHLQSGNYVRDFFPVGVHITGTIGELNKNKNQIVLIEEAKNDPNMYVAIGGAGENRLFLQKKIEEYKLDKRVILFGFVEPLMVLKGFDRFALPSLKEGLPYVLLEAKAVGLPIVADRTVGGIAEIIDAPDMSEFSLERMLAKTIAVYKS